MKAKARGKSRSPALSEMTIDEKKGTVNAYGERFLFIPVKLINSIEDRLVKSLGPITATSFEYEIGREGGGQYIQIAQKTGLDVRTQEGIQRLATLLGTMSGWGKVDVVDFDVAKKIVRIRWKNGVSVRNRSGKTPVCHFGRGILTGAVSEILGIKCESIELSCQGKGDSYCEAVVGEPREISRLFETMP